MAKDGRDRAKYRPLRQSRVERRMEAIQKYAGMSRGRRLRTLRETTDPVERDVFRKLLALADGRRHGG